MKLMHFAKKENSGLFRSTLEIVNAEQKLGHEVTLREPTGSAPIYGSMKLEDSDVDLVHSQFPIENYHTQGKKPRFMWMHGEPLSSVGNGVSMKAIVDLAPLMDAFICMRKEEQIIWNSIKRTYYVPKGIDLDVFKPLDGVTERLSGEPAVLYIENWRGQRNPLYLCIAMEQVWRKYPKARLHLYNMTDQRMSATFKALAQYNKWGTTFLRSMMGAVDYSEINLLYNRVDMVVSCLYPLYARGIEAFGAGKAFIGPGYTDPDYPFHCDLEPTSMANAIIECWENYGKVNYRKWAEEKHDATEMVRQSIDVYQKYL